MYSWRKSVLAILWTRVARIRNLVRPRELRWGRWRNSYTNVIGGSLIVILGAFLFVTRGTLGLSSLLSADAQVHLAEWAIQAGDLIPNKFVVAPRFSSAASADVPEAQFRENNPSWATRTLSSMFCSLDDQLAPFCGVFSHVASAVGCSSRGCLCGGIRLDAKLLRERTFLEAFLGRPEEPSGVSAVDDAVVVRDESAR